MRNGELLRIQIETLFTKDARGRLVRLNEPNGKPAPRFFLGTTIDGNEWRVRHDVSCRGLNGAKSHLSRPPEVTGWAAAYVGTASTARGFRRR